MPVDHQVLQQFYVPINGINAIDKTSCHYVFEFLAKTEWQGNNDSQHKQAIHCVHYFRKEHFEFAGEPRRITLQELELKNQWIKYILSFSMSLNKKEESS
jgi:hypothetical protein